MKLVFSLIAALTFLASTISMQGIEIGDSQSKLKELKLKVKGQEDDITKFETGNGNDFSVTTENGKVVYMENDWLQKPEATTPLYSDFKFGETSLKDIRTKYGTNGFSHTQRSAFTTKTHLIEFNCFEFDSPRNEVLVVITKVGLKEDVTEENVAEKLKLDAIIITTKDYLDGIWGTEKVYDPNYKKIKP